MIDCTSPFQELLSQCWFLLKKPRPNKRLLPSSADWSPARAGKGMQLKLSIPLLLFIWTDPQKNTLVITRAHTHKRMYIYIYIYMYIYILVYTQSISKSSNVLNNPIRKHTCAHTGTHFWWNLVCSPNLLGPRKIRNQNINPTWDKHCN